MQARERGFTLLELMIVVAVIAILAAIAYPNYSRYVIKTRRAAAAGCLMENAQFLERYHTTNMTYTGAADPPAQCDASISPQHYTISFGVAPLGNDYTLLATPQNGQAANDTLCGELSLTAQGVKGAAAAADKCW